MDIFTLGVIAILINTRPSKFLGDLILVAIQRLAITITHTPLRRKNTKNFWKCIHESTDARLNQKPAYKSMIEFYLEHKNNKQ